MNDREIGFAIGSFAAGAASFRWVLLGVFLHPLSLFLAGLLLGMGFGLGFPTFAGIVAGRVDAERSGAVGLLVSSVGYAAIFWRDWSFRVFLLTRCTR
jgi:hypothetical protein